MIDPHDNDTIELLPETQKAVIQDNELITARYVNKLHLQDRRLMFLAISKLDQTKARYDWEDRFVRVHAREFADIFKITHHDFYADLANACRRLWQTDVCISENGPNKKFVRVFEAIGYIETEGFVELMFTPSIMLYLTTISQQYTLCQLRQLARLESTHAMSLYQLCRKFKSTGLLRISVEEFRRILGIEEDQYTKFNDLRTKLIDRAIRQINKKTDLNIQFSTTKEGVKIKNLEFRFKPESH